MTLPCNDIYNVIRDQYQNGTNGRYGVHYVELNAFRGFGWLQYCVRPAEKERRSDEAVQEANGRNYQYDGSAEDDEGLHVRIYQTEVQSTT